MIKYNDLYNILQQGELDETLKLLYPSDDLPKQKKRYLDLMEMYREKYSSEECVSLYSAPGRTEVGGNHTDHNHGKVLAASINLDVIAVAGKNDKGIIHECSVGHSMNSIDINDLDVKKNEYGKSCSLIRGICAGFKNRGYNIGGFNAVSVSQVLSGSGLSSSAAYEVLIGTILNHMYNEGKISSTEIAQIAQYAENVYFNKPCGLLDQTACSVGSFVTIDFKNPVTPVIDKVNFDFSACGHSLCIVDSGGSHSNLTDEYAAVKTEMNSVAAFFGKEVLRDVPESDFYARLADVREKTSDRAVLRAIHFYSDNCRVELEVEALKNGDFEEFKSLIIDSGRSSYMYNQNVYTCKNPETQPVSLALAMCENILKGKGAWRVHGGGFAGTVQAFVPNDILAEFKARMCEVFGDESCYVLNIRSHGGVDILKLN